MTPDSSPDINETFSDKVLNGKVAVVTGAGQPIGSAIARRFGKAGARLALVHLPDEEEAAQQLAREVGARLCVSCELSDPASVNVAMQRILGELKNLDVLVNGNISRVSGQLCELTHEQWSRVVERQLSGTLYFCKEAIRPMMRKRAGKIISILDIAPGGASTVAAKGIAAMTRALASEASRSGIYVNTLAVSVLPDEAEKLPERQRERIKSELGPLGRLGNAEEIAESALFLASAASNLTTGHALSVSGGLW